MVKSGGESILTGLEKVGNVVGITLVRDGGTMWLLVGPCAGTYYFDLPVLD